MVEAPTDETVVLGDIKAATDVVEEERTWLNTSVVVAIAATGGGKRWQTGDKRGIRS